MLEKTPELTDQETPPHNEEANDTSTDSPAALEKSEPEMKYSETLKEHEDIPISNESISSSEEKVKLIDEEVIDQQTKIETVENGTVDTEQPDNEVITISEANDKSQDINNDAVSEKELGLSFPTVEPTMDAAASMNEIVEKDPIEETSVVDIINQTTSLTEIVTAHKDSEPTQEVQKDDAAGEQEPDSTKPTAATSDAQKEEVVEDTKLDVPIVNETNHQTPPSIEGTTVPVEIEKTQELSKDEVIHEKKEDSTEPTAGALMISDALNEESVEEIKQEESNVITSNEKITPPLEAVASTEESGKHLEMSNDEVIQEKVTDSNELKEGTLIISDAPKEELAEEKYSEEPNEVATQLLASELFTPIEPKEEIEEETKQEESIVTESNDQVTTLTESETSLEERKEIREEITKVDTGGEKESDLTERIEAPLIATDALKSEPAEEALSNTPVETEMDSQTLQAIEIVTDPKENSNGEKNTTGESLLSVFCPTSRVEESEPSVTEEVYTEKTQDKTEEHITEENQHKKDQEEEKTPEISTTEVEYGSMGTLGATITYAYRKIFG